MKLIKLIIIFAMLLTLTGCLGLSINGFYTKGDLTQDERILGKWTQVKEQETADSETGNSSTNINLHFENAGSSGYDLELTEGEKTNLFAANLFLLNDILYLDLYPQVDALKEVNSYFSSHLAKAHSVAKVEINDTQLKLIFMDSDNLKKIILRKKIKNEYTVITANDDQILLTGQTEEVQKLIGKYATELFSNTPLVFKKDL